MPIGTPIERYSESLASQTDTSAFSLDSQINNGRVAVLLTTQGGGKTITGVTDTAGNTWSVDVEGNTGGPCVAIASCQVTSAITTGDTITISYDSAVSSTHQIWVLEITGLVTSAAFDKSSTNTDTGTNVTSGATGTLSQADEIGIAIMRTNTASSWTKGASETDVTTPTLGSPPSAAEYRIVSSTASINMSGTLGTSGAWSMAAATYRMASRASIHLFSVGTEQGVHNNMMSAVTPAWAAVAWPSANRIMYVPVAVPKNFTIQKFCVLNGGTLSGNLDIGLYTSEGVRIIATGSTAQSGTNVVQEIDVTDTEIPPGWYYLALVLDNATGTIMRAPSTTPSKRTFGCRQQDSTFPLPASATFTAVTDQYWPAIKAMGTT